MRIALDAMGGDNAPAVPVQGALEALDRAEELELVLVGDPDAIERELARRGVRGGRFEIVPAPEVIAMDEPPVEAVRAKPTSSVVRGLELQKDGDADAFVSAGSTGAILAASIMVLGSLSGIERPALGALLPTAAPHPTLLLDVGANVDCRPQQLECFAHLGHIYVRDLVGRGAPRIGLLNIGTEAGKGDDRTVEAYRLLQASGLNFVGNVEGREILSGKCDVLVCDGFVGNVVLKFYEAVAADIASLVSRTLADSGSGVDLTRMCRVLDYAEYGGAPLLGVNGVVVVCHGASPARAVRHAVSVAARAVERGMVAHLERELEGYMRVGARA